ncbi:Kappa-type opioid receptor [Myotis davidii]|uniref:Kappa-type opioid receptor n=2 Tax=Myotis TaxID=9434 RepID=L5LJV1_MYODS|nr:Kappa-type opioid receptor [Myotis davidii]
MDSCTSGVPRPSLQGLGQNRLSDIPQGVLDGKRVQARLKDPTSARLGLGRDRRRAPGHVWPISPNPDWPDPSSKLTYRSEHLPPDAPEVQPVLTLHLRPWSPRFRSSAGTRAPPARRKKVPGRADPDSNSSAGSEDTPLEASYISPAIPVIITAVYSLVFVVGLVGNSLVMFVIIRYTKMKTATNIYIFNLALADALVTTTMPFQSTVYLMNSWPFGDVLCKIVISIDYYNMFTSIFTLTMMSVDRYIAVCHPVKALDFRTPLNAKIINICIWLLSSSVGISAIVLGGTKVREDLDVIECSLQFPDDDYSWWDLFMKICVFVFAFVIPVIIIIICYTLMILRLKSVRLLSGSREKDRNLRRITRLVLVVVAVFIICWTPIHIFILVEALGSTSHSTAALSSYYFCIALGYTNSSLNPILYAFLDENFKRCFRDFCFPIKMRMERQSTSRVRNTVQDPAYVRDVDGINKPV